MSTGPRGGSGHSRASKFSQQRSALTGAAAPAPNCGAPEHQRLVSSRVPVASASHPFQGFHNGIHAQPAADVRTHASSRSETGSHGIGFRRGGRRCLGRHHGAGQRGELAACPGEGMMLSGLRDCRARTGAVPEGPRRDTPQTSWSGHFPPILPLFTRSPSLLLAVHS